MSLRGLDALRNDVYRAVTTPRHPAAAATANKDDGAPKQPTVVGICVDLLFMAISVGSAYVFGTFLANAVQSLTGKAGPGTGDATDEFLADNGGTEERGVAGRLQRLLRARHKATLRAMTEELEDHQSEWKRKEEEKKEQDESEGEEDAANARERMRTERQYSQLQDELHVQHQESLSRLAQLSSYEMSIAQSNVIDPANLKVTFADVGGMDDIKREIYDLVVTPLLRPDLFTSDSGLVSPPKGILLYGPPGTGKTMIAKAIAKESHATFVNVQLSTIMNKWFGESNKMISATFQLARKLAPSVVFIDEIDAFLSARDGTEGSAVSSMKSEFLTLWDGLLSERRKGSSADADANNNWRVGLGGGEDGGAADAYDNEQPLLPTPPIIVLGATNRPFDIDPAILRRLPRSFEVPLPPFQSRLQLLQLFLQKQDMTPSARDFLPKLARLTEGYSGSDLKELCRAAAWEPVREMTTRASQRAVGIGDGNSNGKALRRTSSGFPARGSKARPVNEDDFLLALQKVGRTGDSARQFHKKEFLRGREERAAMEADISREAARSDRKAGRRRQEDGDRNLNDQLANVDMQQLMAMAMAAAASSMENDPDTPSSADIPDMS
ncbi:hypothetical protein ACHAXT_009752 [Thalassiosira profunda]